MVNPQPPDPRAGRKPFPPLRRPSSISKSAPPPTPPEPPTPQRTTQEKFFISTTYSTIAARALSFQGQVLSGVTPLQLAKNGFHYQPFSSGGLACCFACQSARRLDSLQRTPFQELQQLHRADCIWKVISSDLRQHLDSTDTSPLSIDIPPPPHQSSPSPFLSLKSDLKKTNTDASTQTQSKTEQTVLPTAEECSNGSRARPLSTTTNPESRLPPPTLSPQPPRPIPTITTPPLNQPTYASILQQPTTAPQSNSKTREPIPLNRPILTIEDLHRRFYNKPSPFQLESKTRKRSASHNRNKPVSATKSLSKFLTSALPAFSRFLAEMQPNPNNRRSPSQSHHNPAMRVA